jgi:hypothetical protein
MEYELYHHGILGMKWGIRRYQNKDGTLTPEGRKRLLSRQKEINRAIDDYKTADTAKKQVRAQKKVYRLMENYAELVNRIEYNKLSDEEVLRELKNFKFNECSLSALIGSEKVNAKSDKSDKNGKLSSQDRSEIYKNLSNLGIGVKNAAVGAGTVIGLISLIRRFKAGADVADFVKK